MKNKMVKTLITCLLISLVSSELISQVGQVTGYNCKINNKNKDVPDISALNMVVILPDEYGRKLKGTRTISYFEKLVNDYNSRINDVVENVWDLDNPISYKSRSEIIIDEEGLERFLVLQVVNKGFEKCVRLQVATTMDFKKFDVIYSRIINLDDSKIDLAQSLRTILRGYKSLREGKIPVNETRKFKQILKENAVLLKDRVLLIDEFFLTEEFDEFALKKIYPYQFLIISEEEIIKKVFSGDSKYSYLIGNASMNVITFKILCNENGEMISFSSRKQLKKVIGKSTYLEYQTKSPKLVKFYYRLRLAEKDIISFLKYAE